MLNDDRFELKLRDHVSETCLNVCADDGAGRSGRGQAESWLEDLQELLHALSARAAAAGSAAQPAQLLAM